MLVVSFMLILKIKQRKRINLENCIIKKSLHLNKCKSNEFVALNLNKMSRRKKQGIDNE